MGATPGVVQQVRAEAEQGEPDVVAGGSGVGVGLCESYGGQGGSERAPDDHPRRGQSGCGGEGSRAARTGVYHSFRSVLLSFCRVALPVGVD
jgi:hypothetical protein